MDFYRLKHSNDKLPSNDRVSSNHWYLWDKNEMEFADHLSLNEYLTDAEKQTSFNKEATQSSFLLGKFAFRKQDQVADMENFILDGIGQLLPLYQKLAN